MKILTKKGRLEEAATEAVVVTFYEGETVPGGTAALVDRKTGGVLSEVCQAGDFTGRLHETVVLYPRGKSGLRRVVAVGLGKRGDFSLERLRGAYARAAQRIRELQVESFAAAPGLDGVDVPVDRLAEALVEGVKLGLYQFLPFKTLERDSQQEVKELTIFEEREEVLKTIRTAVRTAETVADAVLFTRDVVSMPANEMTPTDLAAEAREMARGKNIKVQVIEEPELRELGMNGLLGVAAGSEEPPKFIVLEYHGGKKSSPYIVLVGKGITFDSGGISIKPSENMEQMKSDMAGGAAVMGAIRATAELGLPLNLVGLIPATENLPGGRALKPGDILKTLSGQTVEIVSTDAEGRLILADALTYAARYKPAAIIDLATLTGACIVALGDHVIGMLGNDEELMADLREAAEETGERLWQLPLWEEYHELIKGSAADYKNSGGRAGSTITAAAFLSKFTQGYPWVHLDIAGPSWLTKDKPYIPKGASGVGVRLLVSFLRHWYQERRR